MTRDKAADVERARRWQLAHPDRFAAIYTSVKANRRAKHWGAAGRVSADDIESVWRRQPRCVGCGVGRGLDHIVPLSLGGLNVAENLQNLCTTCNNRKGQRAEVPAVRMCSWCGVRPVKTAHSATTHCSRRCGQRHRHAARTA